MDAGAAILLTAILVLVNGFFVAAEYSFVRVRGTQLDELAKTGSVRAKLAARISDDIEPYISTVQLGVTLASLGVGLLGEPAVSRLIDPVFGWLRDTSDAAFHVVSFLIAFALVTYVTVVFGELAPKYLAIQRPLPVALWTAHPLHYTYRAAYPFIWLMNRSAAAVLRAVGAKATGDLDVHSDEELKMLVAASARQGVLQESERVIVGNALDFADTVVRQVMIPRTEIAAVPEDLDLGGLIAVARQTRLSRFPVYREDLDHVVGVVHVKDLVGVDRTSHAKARDLMRRVPFIPETLRLDQALAEFRRQRAGLAIVIDEFGGTAGVVTLADILEELVGEVRDEFEPADVQRIREEAPGTFSIDGLVALDDLRDRLQIALAGEPYDTVGGLVFGRLGRVAEVGDVVEVEGYRFQVTAVDGRRVAQVRVQKMRPARRPRTA
ncbi:MAG TPA: hemolysin family protein [Candidatus Limnocylindria bacterium]|nr:hemolysin family protein [Candidatus Limnocylindria bacterium]